MKVCIHRGSKEIGGSCVEVVADCGRRLVLDLGLPLDAEFNDKKYLPNIPGLDGNDVSLLAVLISHPHLDHFGLLGHISGTVPVIMGRYARNILTKAAPFLRGEWHVPANGPNLQSEVTFELGPFRITPYLIDHSGYDSYCLLIEADGKRLFYSGDFRMHGRKAKLTEKLMTQPPEKIDVLLLEGSSLGRTGGDEAFPTETEIENNEWFDLLNRHSKNRIYIEKLEAVSTRSVLLFRPIHMNDLEAADLLNDAVYVYSQWEGYWEKEENEYLRDWIGKKNIPKTSIHTSGHAGPADLKRFAEALVPDRIVPIHTFMPEKFPELFRNVDIRGDGEYWEV